MSGELILVIDDSEQITKHLAEHLLPLFGFDALSAMDGHTGLELIRKEKPDLIMLDLNLPEMTGLDVLQAMVRESIETPVIFMTGYGSEKSAVEAFRLGVKDYLVKPFTIDEVRETINRALLEKRLRHDKQTLIEKLRQAEGEMRRQVNEISTLFGIGKAVFSLRSVDRVVERVLDAALYMCNAEQSLVWLPDSNRATLRGHAKQANDTEFSLPDLPVEGSRVGEVFQTGEIIRQSDFSGAGIKVKTDFLARAILLVPLTVRGETIGVLGVSNHTAPRAFSERDEMLLAALSDYASIALENARVYQATDAALAARMEELKTLVRVTRTVTSSLNLDDVLQTTIKEVHDSWDIEASSVWLLDEATGKLRVLVNVGTERDLLSQCELDVGEGIVGHVVQTGKGTFTNDVANHPLHYQDVDNRTGFKTHSLLCVPLVFRDEIIGALQLLNKQNGLFDESDVEWASSIAAAVAIAVTNALLFRDAASRQQLLAATLEHNGHPTIITDAQGRLLLLNQRARQQLRLAKEDIGRPAGLALEPFTELTAFLAEPLEPGETKRRELSLSDDIVWLCTLAPIPEYGRILVLQDITYLKELDAAKSNFVAAVSHDLRAPLNSIAGFAGSLTDLGSLNEEQQVFVERIVDSAERMIDLVTGLLNLARVDSRLEHVQTECDVLALTQNAIQDLQGKALTKQVSLRLETERELVPFQGDPTQIRQAISNLIDNAINFSPAGEEVRIILGLENGNLTVAVLDNGAGVSNEDAPFIFDKFYQAQQGGRSGLGSGLGLTLVRSVARAHGGTVSVANRQPQGSVFTLQLPIAASNGPGEA